MKNFERKDKNERRRVLLSKNNVNQILSKDRIDIDYSNRLNQSDATGAAATSAVLAKVQGMNRKMLAVVLAVAMVLSLLTVGIIHSQAADSRAGGTGTVKKDNANLITDKQVTPGPDANNDGRPDTYDITLTSYLEHPTSISDADKTDTVLVLERSLDMNNELYKRDKTNLQTYTSFSTHDLASNNSMFDTYNAQNSYITIPDNVLIPRSLRGYEIKISVDNTYQNNKYIQDPNNPNVYVYVCQTYESTVSLAPLNAYNHYTYSIVDTQGNVYESNTIDESIWNTLINLAFDDFVSSLSTINFTWKKNINYPNITTYNAYVAETGLSQTKRTFSRSQFFTRDDDNATNASLWEKQRTNGPLWIKDNDGNWLKVKIYQEGTYSTRYGDYTPYYVYRAFAEDDDMTDPSTALYSAVYGNPYYGSEQSVFQGFKVYNSDGTVDYENSLLHKSLYSSESNEVSVSRLQALKESVEDFILQVYQNTRDSELPDGYQRVGIVSYCDDDETKIEYELDDVKSEEKAYKMITTVYNFEADGRRRIDTGLEYAKTCLDHGNSAGRKINVVSFTAGNPSYRERNNDFEMIIADNALARKQVIENAYSTAKFYSIGLYEGSDANELHGDSFRRLSHSAIPCDGSAGTFWGGTLLAGWTNPDMSPADAAATNRFLNYLSSNYKPQSSAQKFSTETYNPLVWFNIFNSRFDYGSIRYNGILGLGGNQGFNTGITGEEYILPNIFQYGFSTGGYGYNINKATPQGAWSNDGYYIAATTGTDLADAFDTIADAIELPLSNLDADTELIDYVSDYFTIEEVLDAYAENENGSRDDSIAISVDSLDNGVVAKGLDYSAHSIDGPDGKKMVVKLRVKTIDDFLGGNQVPTNKGESGVYDKNRTLVENFDVPTVDIKTNATVTAHDLAVYLTQTTDLWDLFDVDDTSLDGLRNDFVDVKYVVSKVSENEGQEVAEEIFTYSIDSGLIWSSEEDGEFSISGEEKVKRYFTENDTTKYSVKCIVTPIYTGNATESVAEEQPYVYVYKPVIDLQDTKKTLVQAHAGVDLNENVTNKNDIEWVPEGAEEGTTVPEPSGSAPSITYAFFNENDNPETANPLSNPVTLDGTTNYRVVATVNGVSYPYTTDLAYYVLSDGTIDSVPTSQHPIDDTQNYPELKKVQITVYDDQGRETLQDVTYTTLDDQGREVTHYVYETTILETNVEIPARSTSDGVTYRNFGLNGELDEDDTEKTNDRTEGNFTVYVGSTYKLYISKEFKGDFVVPEDVKFTITGTDNTTQELTITATQINRLKSGDILVGTGEGADFATGVKYTVVEDFLNQDTPDSKYDTTATIKQGASGTPAALDDNDPVGQEDDKAEFDFTIPVDEDPGVVYIAIKNTDNSTPPPVTGKTNADSKVNPFLIAAGVLALASGAWIAPLAKRKSDAEAG